MKVLHQPTGKVILCYEVASGDVRLIHTVGKKNNPSQRNLIHKWPEKMLSSKAE